MACVLREVPLDMTFADVLADKVEDTPDAYERLIMDVIRGNQTPVYARWTRSKRHGHGLIRCCKAGRNAKKNQNLMIRVALGQMTR